jgi:hypothetical protein
MKLRTTGTIRAAVEGQPEEDLRCGDALAVPPWHANTLHGIKDANLLRVTDEPILAKFGLLRHHWANDPRMLRSSYSGRSAGPADETALPSQATAASDQRSAVPAPASTSPVVCGTTIGWDNIEPRGLRRISRDLPR